MLEILAIAPRDGWAFVRERRQAGDRILLIRPPFREAAMAEVDSATVDTAILRHGFSAGSGEFSNFAALIAHLKSEIVESARREGAEAPPEDVAERVLKSAPAATIERLLRRVERELIPRREYVGARKVLLALMDAKATGESGNLRSRIAALLKQAEPAEPVELLPEPDLPLFRERYGASRQVFRLAVGLAA